MEVLGERATNAAVQIFATDLSEIAIAKARLGLYSSNEVANISPKRLQRFFTRVDGSYRIAKSIRDLCVFAPHNIFKDPPFSRLDFVSCCNLMIYLDSMLQKKILATFHYSLSPDGYLMLGKSETIGAAPQLFTQVEKKYKIYTRKTEVQPRAVFEMNYRLPGGERSGMRENLRNGVVKDPLHAPDLDKAVDDILLTKYVPASVVVNQDLEILQFRGSTGFFLEPSPGKASLSLLKMARPGLAFELRSAIHKANKSWQAIKKEGLEINNNGQTHQVSIEVQPLKADLEERLFLVIFETVRASGFSDLKSTLSRDKLVKQLQDELNAVKEDMRSIIEEQEASNEELQSANEEIVSSNEELQSINEELETSKEEVESTNEELMTINTELQVRNEQLAEAYEYAEAVFGTIREAVIVLDAELRVKSANRAFYKIFQSKEDVTEGMLIYELGNRQWDIPELRSLLENVVYNDTPVFGHEIQHEFPGVGKKIMLVNARRIVQKIHRQQLVLLAIEDITEHRAATAK
jgi:two-component system, chemotaxis family, CheB/CheR fusion protein